MFGERGDRLATFEGRVFSLIWPNVTPTEKGQQVEPDLRRQHRKDVAPATDEDGRENDFMTWFGQYRVSIDGPGGVDGVRRVVEMSRDRRGMEEGGGVRGDNRKSE